MDWVDENTVFFAEIPNDTDAVWNGQNRFYTIRSGARRRRLFASICAGTGQTGVYPAHTHTLTYPYRMMHVYEQAPTAPNGGVLALYQRIPLKVDLA